MLNGQQLLNLVDWDLVMENKGISKLKAEIRAAIHSRRMEMIFSDNAKVISHYSDISCLNDLFFLHEEVIAYEFKDGTIALISEYTGKKVNNLFWDKCDSNANSNLLREMITWAKLFPNKEEAIEKIRLIGFCITKKASKQLIMDLSKKKE
jgi:hypothetical protein